MTCLLVGSWLAALSVVGFTLAVADKAQARAGRRRVPELVLLAAAWLGGWPGLLLAFVLARHKVRKGAFLAPFLVGVLVSTVGFLVLLQRLDCIPDFGVFIGTYPVAEMAASHAA